MVKLEKHVTLIIDGEDIDCLKMVAVLANQYVVRFCERVYSDGQTWNEQNKFKVDQFGPEAVEKINQMIGTIRNL